MLKSSPFSRDRRSTAQIMSWVSLALLPGVLTLHGFFGPGVWLNLLASALVAVVTEALILHWRKRPVLHALSDGSAMLTGILLALALPNTAPYWLVALGSSFAILFGKQLYGGLGMNPFNPAMLGYAFLLLSFPLPMIQWLPPAASALHPVGWADAWSIFWSGHDVEYLPVTELLLSVDSLTSATPLDSLRTGLSQMLRLTEIVEAAGFAASQQAWFWVNLAFAAGGLLLMRLKLIDWRIPAALLMSLALCSSLGWLVDADRYTSPWFHWFAGASMLGAFFIATDPVTAATTSQGRWIYGAVIGLLLYLIRTFGGYPDAVAFAVLLANILVPSLDRYCRPPVYGHPPRGPQA